MKRHFPYLIGMLALLMQAIASCTSAEKKSEPSRTLTVSIEPQRYLLQRIVGDGWDVNTLLAKGADPENFDPALSSLKSLQDSRAYFLVGTMPFERTIIDRINHDESLRIVNTSAGINMIEGSHGHHHDNHAHDSHSHDYDPHVWSSVKNAEIIARNMYEAMIELDPDNASAYTTNYNLLSTELDSLDRELAKTLSPVKNTAFLVWHPSLSYFARDYSLQQIAMGMDNKELSADAFRRRIDDANGNNAAIFFVQPEFDANRSDNIVRQTGIPSVQLNTLSFDFPAEMRRIANSIASAHNTTRQ